MDTLRRWIAEGAKWEKHWAFVPAGRPELPTVADAAWARKPIDRFVLARLEQEGLTPSPEADRATLIRRVSLDLTGLPPTPAEVDAFLADSSPDAYEKAGRPAAGFAALRRADGVALARRRPLRRHERLPDRRRPRHVALARLGDRRVQPQPAVRPFTIEQLAGDLLPNATLDQRIATGFNRNHRGNAEGGIVPEEYAVEYVVDRVETTATVWLGLTLGCARCHDHKYDPITQKEFYQLFAFFNNVPENGQAVKFGNSPPFIKAPTPEQAEATRRARREPWPRRWSASCNEPRVAKTRPRPRGRSRRTGRRAGLGAGPRTAAHLTFDRVGHWTCATDSRRSSPADRQGRAISTASASSTPATSATSASTTGSRSPCWVKPRPANGADPVAHGGRAAGRGLRRPPRRTASSRFT